MNVLSVREFDDLFAPKHTFVCIARKLCSQRKRLRSSFRTKRRFLCFPKQLRICAALQLSRWSVSRNLENCYGRVRSFLNFDSQLFSQCIPKEFAARVHSGSPGPSAGALNRCRPTQRLVHEPQLCASPRRTALLPRKLLNIKNNFTTQQFSRPLLRSHPAALN